MTSLSEEIELLARLEIETIMSNEDFEQFTTGIETIYEFPITKIIAKYFINGAVFGAEMSDETSELDRELFVLRLHEDMTDFLRKSSLNDKSEKSAIELFEKLFVQGMHWSIIHQEYNATGQN